MTNCGRYQIERELGRGACGITYLARDPGLNREVALKLLVVPHTLQGAARVDHVQRFLREAQSACAIRHPGVPEIYEVGNISDEHFIAMEYCPGQTLREVLDDRGVLPLEQALRITGQVLEILQEAHAVGIFHRDIKPDNLMLSPDEQSIKVMDFGIARRLGDTTLTRTGAPIGTPSYMSPEQALGERVDGRSDLFSVAILLHELATGKRPFAGATLPQLLHAIVYSEPELAPTLPTSVAQIIRTGLAKKPGERFPNAEQMQMALAMAQPVDAPLGQPPDSPADPTDPFGPFDPSAPVVRGTHRPNSAGAGVPTIVGPGLHGSGHPSAATLPGLLSTLPNAASGYLSTLPGLLRRRDILQFSAAVGAFVIAATLLVAAYNNQTQRSTAILPARSPSAQSLSNPLAPRNGLSPGGSTRYPAGGFGQIPGTVSSSFYGSGTPRPTGPPPTAPPLVSAGPDVEGEITRLPRRENTRNRFAEAGSSVGSYGDPLEPEVALPNARPDPRRPAAPSSTPGASFGSPATTTPPVSSGTELPPPSSIPEATLPAPPLEGPRASRPPTATQPSPSNPTPRLPRTTSRPPSLSGSVVRGATRNRVRGGDRVVYTIPSAQALNYGIRTTQRIPDPGRYGYWYATISPREAWEQHHIRVLFPIPDPKIYGLPPVPLRKLPPADLEIGD